MSLRKNDVLKTLGVDLLKVRQNEKNLNKVCLYFRIFSLILLTLIRFCL